jgi:hypothetical protein
MRRHNIHPKWLSFLLLDPRGEELWFFLLFLQQKEALNSQVEALIQEKENENVLIDMELINLKNVFSSIMRKLEKHQMQR